MAQTFDLSHAPFDRLSPAEADVVGAAVDIGYFRRGETILARDAAPESLFIVLRAKIAASRRSMPSWWRHARFDLMPSAW
jgi:CBS domain-containing protein